MNTRLIFTHVYFADLLSSSLLCRSPGKSVTTLFGVAEDLAMEELEFPVLLDKSVDGDTIIVEPGAGGGGEHRCELRYS